MPPRRVHSLSLKGLWLKLCPYFTLFSRVRRVYHYAISELCKGLYHHNVV